MSNKTLHVMVDIETLSLDVDAVVMQIGLVFFKQDGDIISEHLFNLSVSEQIMAGRHIDQNTLNWWQNQQKEVKDSLTENIMSTKQAIDMISRMFQDKLDQGYELVFWANGLLFDTVVLNTLFDQFGGWNLSRYFKYNNFADFRTLRKALQSVSPKTVEQLDKAYEIMTKHNALSDAIWQAKQLIKYGSMLSKLNEVYQ